MSLFTDPEVPPPLPLISLSVSGSDHAVSDVFDQADAATWAKRLHSLRHVVSFKGFTACLAVAVVALLMLLYSSDRVRAANFYSSTSQSEDMYANMLMSFWPDDARQEDDVKDPKFPWAWETTISKGSPNDTALQTALEEFRPLPEMTLHYLWCGRRFFDFRNFLAVKSAIDAIKPREVRFHFQNMPMNDPDGYFSWFETLQDMYPIFVMENISQSMDCFSGFERFVVVFDVLQRYGGVYAPENAIFLRLLDRFRDRPFLSGIVSCNLEYFQEGFVFAQKGQFRIPGNTKEQVKMLSGCLEPGEDVLHPCITGERFKSGNSSPTCVKLTTTIFPKTVWAANDSVSTLAKIIAYGTTDLKPRSSAELSHRVPRIAHYLCTEDCRLSFSHYLSILSAVYVGGLRRVLIHGPQTPSGPWWDALQQNHSHAVHFLFRTFEIPDLDPSIQINYEMRRYIARTEILLHFGGVFHDSHVIWTQRLPDYLLQFEAVASPDWHAHGDWPESVNHALLIARGGALYLQQLLKMFKKNAAMDLPWFAEHYLSYRIIELDPTLVYLCPHLQVKCLNHNCHPTWHPGYRSNFQLNSPGLGFDWRTDTLSVHWLDSFSPLDLSQVRFASGLIVNVARNVFQAAGIDISKL